MTSEQAVARNTVRVASVPQGVTDPPRDDDPTIEMPRVGAPVPRPRVVSVDVQPATPPGRVSELRARFTFGNPLSYTVARFAAFVLDLAIVSYVVTTFAYALIAISPITGLPTNSERGFDTTFALGVAVALLYVWIAEGVLGTTLGKLAFGLHVYPLRGRGVGLGRSFVRSLLRVVDVLVIGGLLSLLPVHRRIGDLLAGTVVARTRSSIAPLAGGVGLVILAGLPWVTVGPARTFAAIVAFGEFVPPGITHLVQHVLQVFGLH